MNKVQRIDTATVEALAKRDWQNYQKGNTSFELTNWLRDEMIMCQLAKVNTLLMDAKCLSRCTQALASIRQRIGTMMSIKINDTKECLVSFNLDLTLLTNGQRERLNREFDLNLELITEEEKDMTYAHMI